MTTLKPPSEFGADTVVGRMPGRLIGESLDRLGNPTFRLALQTQEQHVGPDKDQLTTDTADLKMTEEALAEDAAAHEDTTQDCQAKAADFEVYTNKSLSEELEALAKAKAVISEKTGDAEYRDNRSVLSSRGGLARELTKSENSIELAQLASRVDFAMHAETSHGDDPFAKVKGLISDMITRLEEKLSGRCYPQGVRSQAHFQLYAFRDRNALHDHVTAQGSVPDDLDDFPRFMHHEIEFRGVLRIMQLT